VIIPAIKLLDNFLKAPDFVISSEEYGFIPFQISPFKTTPKEPFTFPYNIIIGKQAEYCFAYYLKHSKRYNLIASNIQINGAAETIGELDYLVFDSKTKATLHVELACKFYLFDSNSDEPITNNWIGPNRKDRLKKKLDKLKLKQFPLIRRKETQGILKELQIDVNTIKQQLCLKAFLFLRKGTSRHEFSKNYQACIVGYWLPYSEFICEDETALYAVPKKKEWLLPTEHIQEWFGFSDVKTILKTQIENNQSVLVYKKVGSQTVQFFVVWW
tara:strand:- start:109 stop:924 length:816 start_codon:yes stop_codon:yes gene_type:complete